MKRCELFVSLRNKQDISNIFSTGSPAKQSGLSVRYFIQRGQPFLPIQVLWAVPKKKYSAVQRNRIRRVLKEILFNTLKTHASLSSEKPAANIQLVFFPGPDYLEKNHEEKLIGMKKLIDKVFESIPVKP